MNFYFNLRNKIFQKLILKIRCEERNYHVFFMIFALKK